MRVEMAESAPVVAASHFLTSPLGPYHWTDEITGRPRLDPVEESPDSAGQRAG